MVHEIQRPINTPEKQDFAYNSTAIAKTDPNPNHDGVMFLRDRPVYLDWSTVPVNEPVRYLGPDGLVETSTPMPTNPNYIYQAGVMPVFR